MTTSENTATIKCEPEFGDCDQTWGDDPKPICQICPKVFELNRTVLRLLEDRIDTIEPYKCVGCGKIFTWNEISNLLDVSSLKIDQELADIQNPLLITLAEKKLANREDDIVDGDEYFQEDENNSFTCDTCLITFEDKESFQEHLLAEHPVKLCETIKCDLCCAVLKGKRSYRIHRSRVHATEKKYECRQCSMKFLTKSCLRKHSAVHNQNSDELIENDYKQFQCELCDSKYYNKNSLVRHMRRAHENLRQATSEVTNANFVDQNNFAPQFNDVLTSGTHFSEKQFVCSICDEEFKKEYQLGRHKMVAHKDAMKFPCLFCKKEFLSRKDVRMHLISDHKSSTQNQCDVCEKKFTTRAALYRHVKTVHEKSNAFQCELCGKNFTRIEYLRTHKLSVHEKLKPFQCHICGNGLATRPALSRHIQNMHGDAKSDEGGDEADGNTKRPGGVKGIRRDFLKPQPFVCNFCHAKFTQEMNMKRHVKLYHTKDENGQTKKTVRVTKPKILQCHLCPKTASEKSNLIKHIKNVHMSDSLLECPICQKKFILEHNLKWHAKKFHPEAQLENSQTETAPKIVDRS